MALKRLVTACLAFISVICIAGCSFFDDVVHLKNNNEAILASLNNHYDQQYIEELCQQFHLDFHSRMKLKNFSVGMRQKAGIIQAIMEKQELILLDEPTRGLDQESIHIFCQIINQLHQQGHTIMIAAHDYLPDIHYTHIYHLEGQLYLDEMD